MAPAGPNGRTRILTTVANLITDKEIQQCFHRDNGHPPSVREIALARKQVRVDILIDPSHWRIWSSGDTPF